MSVLVLKMALPGGRRVAFVYSANEHEDASEIRPAKASAPPRADRVFAQTGYHFDLPLPNEAPPPRGKKCK